MKECVSAPVPGLLLGLQRPGRGCQKRQCGADSWIPVQLLHRTSQEQPAHSSLHESGGRALQVCSDTDTIKLSHLFPSASTSPFFDVLLWLIWFTFQATETLLECCCRKRLYDIKTLPKIYWHLAAKHLQCMGNKTRMHSGTQLHWTVVL